MGTTGLSERGYDGTEQVWDFRDARAPGAETSLLVFTGPSTRKANTETSKADSPVDHVKGVHPLRIQGGI